MVINRVPLVAGAEHLPVLVMVIIVVCAFEVSLAALLVGLFLDCQYSVEKIPDKNGGGANE